MRYEDEVRDEACSYLGREITDAEWNEALPPAQRKLDWIISREGDLDGERRKPYYSVLLLPFLAAQLSRSFTLKIKWRNISETVIPLKYRKRNCISKTV